MATKKPAKSDPTLKLSLERVISLFVNDGKSRNLSQETIGWYQMRLDHFTEWFAKDQDRAMTLADFTVPIFQQFILLKKGEPRYTNHPLHKASAGDLPSSSYIHGFFRTVRALGNFLVQQGMLEESPMKRLQMPKLEEKQLRPLTSEEEQHLLELFDENTVWGCRTKAILMLMLDAGLRRSELVGLKRSDLFLDEGFLLVKGKGSKERWIPFGYKTGAILHRYVMLYRPEPAMPTIDNLFLEKSGEPMSRVALSAVIERASQKAGIPRLHPHLLRHTFGVKSNEMNVPSLILQRYMGHSDVRTTERYAHAAQSEKIKRDRGFSHVDQLPVKVKKVAKGRAKERA